MIYPASKLKSRECPRDKPPTFQTPNKACLAQNYHPVKPASHMGTWPRRSPWHFEVTREACHYPKGRLSHMAIDHMHESDPRDPKVFVQCNIFTASSSLNHLAIILEAGFFLVHSYSADNYLGARTPRGQPRPASYEKPDTTCILWDRGSRGIFCMRKKGYFSVSFAAEWNFEFMHKGHGIWKRVPLVFGSIGNIMLENCLDGLFVNHNGSCMGKHGCEASSGIYFQVWPTTHPLQDTQCFGCLCFTDYISRSASRWEVDVDQH